MCFLKAFNAYFMKKLIYTNTMYFFDVHSTLECTVQVLDGKYFTTTFKIFLNLNSAL